jgi:hypothetical protein
LQKRLKVIVGLIQLSDADAIASQVRHLEPARRLPEIAKLFDLLGNEDWQEAENYLSTLVPRLTSLVQVDAVEIAELRLELKTLEARVVALSAEQNEFEHLVREFSRRRQIALGDVFGELLGLRQRYARTVADKTRTPEDNENAEAAEKDAQDFKESREAFEREPRVPEISKEERSELKSLFKKAAQKCHPDRVCPEEKDRATELFVKLKQAYERNDVEAVRRIYAHLSEGMPFAGLSETASRVEQLRSEVSRLRLEVEEMADNILAIRSSETFKQVESLDDWDAWFDQIRRQMVEECESLRRQLDEEGSRGKSQ